MQIRSWKCLNSSTPRWLHAEVWIKSLVSDDWRDWRTNQPSRATARLSYTAASLTIGAQFKVIACTKFRCPRKSQHFYIYIYIFLPHPDGITLIVTVPPPPPPPPPRPERGDEKREEERDEKREEEREREILKQFLNSWQFKTKTKQKTFKSAPAKQVIYGKWQRGRAPRSLEPFSRLQNTEQALLYAAACTCWGHANSKSKHWKQKALSWHSQLHTRKWYAHHRPLHRGLEPGTRSVFVNTRKVSVPAAG